MNKVYFLEILITDRQLEDIEALSPFFQRIYERLRIDIPDDDKIVLLIGVKNTLMQGEDRVVELSHKDLQNMSEEELRTLLSPDGSTHTNISIIQICQNRIFEQEVRIAEYLKNFQGDEQQKRLLSYSLSEALLRLN
jgi:hypothetical protein